ncbi:MAG: LysR family transcriptional regulator [Vicinamibacteria bacterium]|nr:LysR family transcriptional regulator [Vicinamibacteria bacterium]
MKSELELRHLRVFATVVAAGTHTRAARSLGLSQSTVSETLSALERALGIELFRKGTKGVLTLTPSGELLLDYARRMLALSQELVGALAGASPDVKATLVVSAVESIGAYVLPSRLAALGRRWPALRVEVMTGSCAEIRQRVASGESDLGLVLEPEAGSDGGEILAKTRLLILGAPGHPLLSAAPTAEALRRCDFYMCDAGGNYHQALRRYFEAAGVKPPRMQAMGTIEGVKRGILAGGTALGLLPEHAVESELRARSLSEVRVRKGLPGVALRAVTVPGAPRSPMIDSLIDSLRGSAQRGLRLTAAAEIDRP